MRLLMLAILLGLSLFFSGCEQRTTRKKKKSKGKITKKVSKTSKKSKKYRRSKSDVGVGNVVDYATGETPLKIRNRKKNQIQQLEGAYKDRYKDELK